MFLFPDEPEIKADKSWIHADVGVELKLSCIVYAEPKAEVRIYIVKKNQQKFVSNVAKIVEVQLKRSMLNFRWKFSRTN